MKKILIAEDDHGVGELYREEFETEGYAVEVVSNGPLALERAKKWRPHIVVIDIGLPEKSGLEVLSAMCKVGTPVILNTAYPLFCIDLKAHRAMEWVVKSSDIEPLKALVRRKLQAAGMETDG